MSEVWQGMRCESSVLLIRHKLPEKVGKLSKKKREHSKCRERKRGGKNLVELGKFSTQSLSKWVNAFATEMSATHAPKLESTSRQGS